MGEYDEQAHIKTYQVKPTYVPVSQEVQKNLTGDQTTFQHEEYLVNH